MTPCTTVAEDTLGKQSPYSNNKINEQSTPYPHVSFKYCHQLASVRQANLHFSHQLIYINTGYICSYPLMMDSGTTHHRWNDKNAFIL